MITKAEINEQIKASERIARNSGWVAIITATKLSKRARKAHLGFRFEKAEIAKVGMTINNGDGSFSEVLAIA